MGANPFHPFKQSEMPHIMEQINLAFQIHFIEFGEISISDHFTLT